jgi:hypothetical protein
MNGWDPKEAVFKPSQKGTMSATNRGGAPRADFDKYYTPDWLIDELVEIIKGHELPEGMKILEPACGSGSIVKKLKEALPEAMLWYYDISPDEEFECLTIDFFDVKPKERYDMVVTNPPYKEAERFIKHALKMVPDGGLVIMLLRVNFFGGQKRAEWLIENPPLECHITVRRPRFRGKGTDACEYGWFVWRKGHKPNFTKTYLLDTRTDKYRKKDLPFKELEEFEAKAKASMSDSGVTIED